MQKNKFSVGDTVEIMQPVNDTIEFKVTSIINDKGNEIESATVGKMLLKVKLPQKVDVNSMLRKQN